MGVWVFCCVGYRFVNCLFVCLIVRLHLLLVLIVLLLEASLVLGCVIQFKFGLCCDCWCLRCLLIGFEFVGWFGWHCYFCWFLLAVCCL